MAGMTLFHTRMNRRKEKAIQEILDRSDKNGNGKIFLADFMDIMDANDIKVEEDELIKLNELSDDNGEIVKGDFLVFIKGSDFWRDELEQRHKPGARTTKVEMMSKSQDKAEAAFRVFDKNKDGYITKDEFAHVSKKLTPKQVDAVFAKFDTSNDGRLSLEEFKRLMERGKGK